MDNLTIAHQSQPISTLAETQAQIKQIKVKHPDCIVLIRKNDWYLTIEEDAVKTSETLGITLTKTQSGEKQAAFPFTALDIYLPKLIRAGHRIAIVDLTNS